jgi:branched-chain amino acid transport system permease protein
MTVPSDRLALLGFALAMPFLPFVIDSNFFLSVAILIGLNAITCVGLNLLIGYAGQISLGHAAFFANGAYVPALLASHFGLPPLAGIALSLVSAALVALAIGRPVLTLRGHYLAMATLGFGVIVSIVINQEVSTTGGPDGMPVPSLSLFGWLPRGERQWYWLLHFTLCLVILLAQNLIRSPIGRALRALHVSEPAAQAAAIDVARYKLMVFVFSAVLASLSGSLFSFYAGFVTPDEAGFLHSVELVVMVVVGGMGSIWGAVIGAALLTALPQILAELHDYKTLAFGLVLVATAVFLRRGIVPSLHALMRRTS